MYETVCVSLFTSFIETCKRGLGIVHRVSLNIKRWLFDETKMSRVCTGAIMCVIVCK